MKNIYFIFFCFSLVNSAIAQNNIGQIWECHTSVDVSNKMQLAPALRLGTVDISPKIVCVFVHVVNRDNGTGGLTNVQVDNWMSRFRSDYSKHYIIIEEIGRSNLNNTTFFNGVDANNYSALIGTNTHANSIDLYLLSPTDNYSRASNIPGIALCVGGSYVETSVLSHEFGHCLGLFHTHSGRGCGDGANCAENINGSNCSTCGDLVCDTPADPCLSGLVNTNCKYIGGNGFNPDVNNIMSYAPPECLTRFSQGQVERMHYTILTNSIIFGTRSRFITGSSTVVCPGSSATFTAHNFPGTVNWTYPTGLSGPSSGNSVTVTNTNPLNTNPHGLIYLPIVNITASVTGTTISLTHSVTTNTIPIVDFNLPSTADATGGKLILELTAMFPPKMLVPFGDVYWSVSPIQGVSWYGYGNPTYIGFCQKSTTYTVTASITNQCGTFSLPKDITITGGYPPVCLPPLLRSSPSGDDDEDFPDQDSRQVSGGSCLCNIIVYPNPVDNTLTIETGNQQTTGSAFDIRLYDGQGNLLRQTTTKGDKVQFNVSNLPNGIYFLHVNDGVIEKPEIRQIIIEH